MITRLNAPNLRVVLYNNITSYIYNSGLDSLRNLDIIPKAHNYNNYSLSGINRNTNKWIDVEFLH
jgi:hypothetical protein